MSNIQCFVSYLEFYLEPKLNIDDQWLVRHSYSDMILK